MQNQQEKSFKLYKESTRDICNSQVDEEQRSQIRDTHHLRTEEYIRQNRSDFGFDDHEANIVGKICKGHSYETDNPEKSFKVLATSNKPWAVKFREHLNKAHGLDIAQSSMQLNEAAVNWKE